MTLERRFLTAEWRDLLMLNYAVDPACLRRFVPAGCELDDPAAILRGSGARIRHVRIERKSDLRAPELLTLVGAAAREGLARVKAAPTAGASSVRPTTGPKRRPRRSA